MEKELEDFSEAARSNTKLSSAPPLTVTKTDDPLHQRHVITCVAICSLAQIGLLIVWLTVFFRLRHVSHVSNESQRLHHEFAPVNLPPTNTTDGRIFYYRDPTTGKLIVRLDFLVDLAYLLKNSEEPLTGDKQHQLKQQKWEEEQRREGVKKNLMVGPLSKTLRFLRRGDMPRE
ncbi:hypothetical protein ECG_05666 [Echinococcus granulosus]|uniref:Expressed conserved protein n=1 Tax=Echinococcus granulosus TaxID=6210 RepID=U6JA19_ECHGR|nr:hypothetical protein EGR_01926 [Echinococcus granulosus]EUB63122.1 hypothetical protein EGR_01926 [Echinococcus granulosus]KAH9281362.1 hypothetical protein ECG_05666 [Echinococcus granulosus]CDS18584.1 expressed conserved protein [Echinococcus granulosus]